MTKFTMAFDVDGVVADMFTPWVGRHNARYPEREPYSLGNVYGPRAVHDDVLLDLLSEASLYDEVLPVEGALTAIEDLKRIGRVVYATSCVQGMTDAKWRWLQRYGLLPPGIRQADDLIVTHDKSLVNADVLVDDHGANLTKFNGMGILFHQPWNAGEVGMFRLATDWTQAAEIIRTLYERSL